MTAASLFETTGLRLFSYCEISMLGYTWRTG